MTGKSMLLFTALMTCATNVWALDDDESFTSYESIVSELKTDAEEVLPVREETDWAAVAMHGGLGVTASFINVEMPDIGITSSGLLKGFEAHFGFNLFSRQARAEAAFRNYAHDALSNRTAADMRELEMRIVFLPELRDRLLLRMGAGVSQRFVDVVVRNPSDEIRRSWSTPYYSLLLGFEKKIAKTVSVGPDFSHHAVLDASSYSKSAWDASFRLNATF
ncbi:MAG: hypothetical protein KF799_11995 [Bdellovibrionales bacterium]|nr:hypothetical protein [Bdellovibrionales bacterium]